MEQKRNFPPWPDREKVRDAVHFVVVTKKDGSDFTIVPTEPVTKSPNDKGEMLMREIRRSATQKKS
ncbi:MAG: hypothetical protein AAB573_01435 [Patescibacteria group bacterium]